MTPGRFEQRNPYKGSPPRPWVRIRLIDPLGKTQELELLADTGNPCALVIGQQAMAFLNHLVTYPISSNFGPLQGGWLQLQMPELGLTQQILGYGSDIVLSSTRLSHPDFEGLAGLPLLRLTEYGGDPDWFWIRALGGTP